VQHNFGSSALWVAALVVAGQLAVPAAGADSKNDQPRQVSVTITRTSKDSTKELVTAPKVTVLPGRTADVNFGDKTDRIEVGVTVNVVGGSRQHEVSVKFAQERDGKSEVTRAPKVTVADRIPAVVSMSYGDDGTIEIKATVSPAE
jgi:hypothetical protein